ncbi:MAG: phosphodiester glycosidase family protein [Ignavibacterium sp.]|nr:phosphodiester glycosidase family protein [Ignavibacterium sp.]
MKRGKKFFGHLVFILLVSLSTNLSSQDTSITVIAPGFKHISIRNYSVPWSIQILEVDLTVPGNKITTALANDRLGNGFEKTSALSTRKSVNGKIVIGAINGDFYGISAPNNPYGFLNNSQIINSEYVFGRAHIRSSFGVINHNKPVAQVIDFFTTITASNSQSKIINECNSQRGTDALILYNKYFGPSTLTNSFGTEVEIQPIDSFITNSNTRCVVTAKQIGVGNMNINPSRYILSGHGVSKTFLDQNFNVGDTVILKMGTSPIIGNVTALIGGGPRLLINGSKPSTFVGFEGFSSDFVNTRHPRTAVGFNQDSTKVYFVVVDGRQSNLSVGMTLDELADLMLSIGCKNAVNLDGGGSSTMVIHNQVVNSPSDPGGERSVANALFAIREMTVTSPSLPNLIQPSNGATNQRDTLILKWSKSPQASLYDLQVSTSPDFSSGIIVNKTIIMDTSFKLTNILGQKTYYWRLRAKNIIGTTNFSAVYSFTTGFPTTTTLLQPPHATTNVSTSPVLIWAKESAATHYRVQLAHGSTIVPSNTILDTLVAMDTTLQLLNLQNNKLYYWRVRPINQYGSGEWSTVFGFKTEPTTSFEDGYIIPDKFYLEQNYPNPVGNFINSDNLSTKISWGSPISGWHTIKLYDVIGREVETIVDGFYEAGNHSTLYIVNSTLPSGIYFYKLSSGNFNSVRKMVIVR